MWPREKSLEQQRSISPWAKESLPLSLLLITLFNFRLVRKNQEWLNKTPSLYSSVMANNQPNMRWLLPKFYPTLHIYKMVANQM
jgi:hypothetical protein